MNKKITKVVTQYIAISNIMTKPPTLAGNPVKVGTGEDAIKPEMVQVFLAAGLIKEEANEVMTDGDIDSPIDK